jgi:hypothetical protein
MGNWQLDPHHTQVEFSAGHELVEQQPAETTVS